MSNFMVIADTIPDGDFSTFSNMVAVRRLRFMMSVFGPPTKAFGGVYQSAKFGWN